MDTTITRPRILEVMDETRLRISNTAFSTNTRDGIKACSDQAAKLRAMDYWTIRDCIRFGFYVFEANVNPNQQKPLLIDLAGRVIGALIEVEGLKETPPIWKSLGLIEDDAALETLKAKECASSLVQEALKQQEEIDRLTQELREAQQQASKADSISAENLLLHADIKAKQEELDKIKSSHQSANEKLRAELQTALAAVTELKAASQRPIPPTVAKLEAQPVPSVDKAELERLRKQVADQAAVIERYKQSKAACIDDEIVEAVEFVFDNYDVPAQKLPVKFAVYFVRTTLDGRT